MKHTPGPWEMIEQPYADRPGCLWIIDRKDAERAIAYVESTKDNARLIACAPELLAALKRLRSWCGSEYQSHPDIDAHVDAVIAKAEGR